jgi:hypothetical protein
MKSVAVTVFAFAFMGALVHADIPRNWNAYSKEQPATRSNENSSLKDPPSNTEIASQINSRRAVEDFSMDGWSISFEVMGAVQDKREIRVLYRAIAVRPGSPQYAYRVYEIAPLSPNPMITVTVEPPQPISACPDGTDMNGMDCGEK